MSRVSKNFFSALSAQLYIFLCLVLKGFRSRIFIYFFWFFCSICSLDVYIFLKKRFEFGFNEEIDFSVFPQFWFELEEELDEHPDDLVQVKSLLTELGYTTKSSIASLKTSKKVESLENEYTKMRSVKSEGMVERFPSLRLIDTITPGLRSIIIVIASHLNRISININQDDLQAAIKNKILQQGKKVCFILLFVWTKY